MLGKDQLVFPSLVCSEEELGNLTRNTARKGSGRTIRPLLLKALLYAYAPGRRKIKVPEEGGSELDRASFRLRNGEMADEKGVDSTRRVGGSDGKRGGAELQRERAALLRGSGGIGCEN